MTLASIETLASSRYRKKLPHRVVPASDYGTVQQMKEDLPKMSRSADSIRDFGGLYLVHGRYLLEPAVSLGCTFASMIDITPVPEFNDRIRAAKARNPALEVEFVNADYRKYQLYDRLRPVEISLLYEVLMHQENYVDVLRLVSSKTTKCICIAQTCLKELFFKLPGGSVLLQFFPEELKNELREGSFWPKEEIPTDTFVTNNWMWGHSTSHIIEVMHGLGWDLEYGEVVDDVCGTYWEFPLLRFAPRK